MKVARFFEYIFIEPKYKTERIVRVLCVNGTNASDGFFFLFFFCNQVW